MEVASRIWHSVSPKLGAEMYEVLHTSMDEHEQCRRLGEKSCAAGSERPC